MSGSGVSRIGSLDALRGIAILMMVLSGMGPYGVMPPWMYHAQLPPPEHVFRPDLPGLTWVDLVFPMFLFALGAAIPQALGKRFDREEDHGRIFLKIGERGLLLGSFAIVLQHMRPLVISPDPGTAEWLLALAGFVLLFMVYLRIPGHWPGWSRKLLRIAGWTGIALFLILVRYPEGGRFSLYRSDIILVVLTNVAVSGSIIWVLTRENLTARLAVLGILLGLRLAADHSGWVQAVWNFSPAPWIYKLYYLQYLFIVIPGTIVGDMLRKEADTKDMKPDAGMPAWVLTGLTLAIVITNLAGMQSRRMDINLMLTAGLLIALWRSIRVMQTPVRKRLLAFYWWGAYWLILGLVFEPFEGGIRKDQSTLSYYFVTGGLSIIILMGFYVLIDVLRKHAWVKILITNGRNPMIAYTGFANLVWPVLALTGLDGLIRDVTGAPWTGFLRGLFYTGLVALVVHFFSRRELYWRT